MFYLFVYESISLETLLDKLQNLISYSVINEWRVLKIANIYAICIKECRINGTPSKTRVDLPLQMVNYSINVTEYNDTTNRGDISLYGVTSKELSYFEIFASNSLVETPTIKVTGAIY